MSGGVERREHGAHFWSCVGVGGCVMAWGGWLFLDATADAPRRVNFAAFVVGSAVAHDLIFVPLVAAFGVMIARVVPRRLRAAVQAGLIASGVVLIVAAAPLRDTAAPAGNPTIQPLDYPSATLTVLALAWVSVALVSVMVVLRSGRRG